MEETGSVGSLGTGCVNQNQSVHSRSGGVLHNFKLMIYSNTHTKSSWRYALCDRGWRWQLIGQCLWRKRKFHFRSHHEVWGVRKPRKCKYGIFQWNPGKVRESDFSLLVTGDPYSMYNSCCQHFIGKPGKIPVIKSGKSVKIKTPKRKRIAVELVAS